jgi:hypothetical protein
VTARYAQFVTPSVAWARCHSTFDLARAFLVPLVMRSHLLRRIRLSPRSAGVLVILLSAACGVDQSRLAGPPPVSGPPAVANQGRGSAGGPGGSGQGSYLLCTPLSPSFGSALIGPPGGDLIVGPHRLIVPPGALTEWVEISGAVPEDQTFRIDLQPHGLVFKKPSGLILDASSCTDVPDIVYLIDDLIPSAPIKAFYSEWWHTIAAPIEHFSGYSIAFRESEEDSEIIAR